jgi:hypothetical protein
LHRFLKRKRVVGVERGARRGGQGWFKLKRRHPVPQWRQAAAGSRQLVCRVRNRCEEAKRIKRITLGTILLQFIVGAVYHPGTP